MTTSAAPSLNMSPPITVAAVSHTYLKAVALFEQRRIGCFAAAYLEKDVHEQWRRHAIALQAAIYSLDSYYEGTPTIEPLQTRPLWQQVELLLPHGPLHTDLVLEGFDDLRRYASAEDRIHAFDTIDHRECPSILQHKCADVRMARSLVWHFAALGPRSSASVFFWQRFDECRELIEDLQDLHEDGRDWNFNFWLYWYMAGLDIERGLTYITGILRRKLHDLESAYARLGSIEQALHWGDVKRTMRDGATTLRRSRSLRALLATGAVGRYGEQDFRSNAPAA